jgi:hypothetical protein
MPFSHPSRYDLTGQHPNVVTKPRIIKNWIILGVGVVGILGAVAWLMFSGKPPELAPVPTVPENPISGVQAPRDDTKSSTLLGVTPDGRYVVAQWRSTVPSTPVMTDDRPVVADKEETAGFEVWDRLKGTRLRKQCIDPLYFDPAGFIIIVQELPHATVVHRFSLEAGEVSKVLDTSDDEHKAETIEKVNGRRLFISTDGRHGVALAKKASEVALVQFNLSTGKVAHRVKIDTASQLVGVSDDGRRALVRHVDKKLLHAWDLVAEKQVTVASIEKGHFAKEDVYLSESPFLADHRTFRVRVFNLPETDPNARWTLQHFDADTGKPLNAGADEYISFDPPSGLWLRAKDGMERQEGFDLVQRIGRDSPIKARLGLSPAYKVRRACFVPGKPQIAFYCEIDSEAMDARRLVQVFDTRTGSLIGDVSRPTDPRLDGQSLLATSNGIGLLFLSKLEKEDRLEMWKITPKPKPVAKKKPSKEAEKEKAKGAF